MWRFTLVWPLVLVHLLQLAGLSDGFSSPLQIALDEVSAFFQDMAGVVGSLASGLKGLEAPVYLPDSSATLKDGDSFQYIVVGAGAAGAVVAARLAQAGHSVLLVEAGGDPDFATRIPGGALALLNSKTDWSYPTLSNGKSCLGFEGDFCRFARGRCLGGSTSMNFMLYVRGNHKDFDDWNVEGWTYNDVKPFFLRSEGFQELSKFPSLSRSYHNTTGQLKVGYFGETYNSWHQRLLDAIQSLGFPRNPDANGKEQVGVTHNLGYVYNGERMSTARAFLTDQSLRSKLKIAKNTLCTSVVFEDGKEHVATGVNVNIRGKIIQLKAKYEVILSAGAIGTPQILMLSGIGHVPHLTKFGIKPRISLPVGDNLSDHVLASFYIKVNKGFDFIEGNWKNSFESRLVGASSKWLSKMEGPLRTIDIVDILTLYNSSCFDYKSGKYKGKSKGCDVPNIQFINFFFAAATLTPVKALMKEGSKMKSEVFEQLWEANRYNAVIMMNVVLLRPYSRGNVRLASPDPLIKPAIFANFLDDVRDVKELVKAVDVIEKLIKTKQFRSENASILRMNIERCPRYAADRDGYWQCYVRHMTSSVQHAVGSAGLGAVVGRRLRVAGARRLRVADLSVAPLLPRGNTEALAVAIGERAAHFITTPESSSKQGPTTTNKRPNSHNTKKVEFLKFE